MHRLEVINDQDGPMSIKQLRSMIVNDRSRMVASKIKDINKTLNAEVQYLSAEIEEINA